MKRLSILLAWLLAPALGGCPGPSDRSASAPEAPQGAVGSEPGGPGNKQYIFFVQLRMLTFEVPMGAASESEQLWSYLDEEPLGIQRSVSLARNGIRIGVGRREDWPDLARLLKRMTGRSVKETTATLLPGRPRAIDLKTKQPAQIVFTYYDDGTLSGGSYPPGDNVLMTVCTLDEDDPSIAQITALPQIRSSYRRPQVVKDRGEMMIASKPVTYSFRPLTFRVAVASQDYILIGPNLASRQPWSVGGSFLVTSKEGVPFETVLLLMPQVRAAPVKLLPLPDQQTP